MINNPLPRLDRAPALHAKLLPFCRLKPGQIWQDPKSGHRVGCLDATNTDQVADLVGQETARLAVHDPPYNLAAFEFRSLEHYVAWCREWIEVTRRHLMPDSSLYLWLGADQTADFQPLPDIMIMMRRTPFQARSFITMRNQRGYGTQTNWMAVRQELLYYTLGNPLFQPQYTEIPKTLSGYYKKIDDEFKDNLERGLSPNIRAGNVWFDVQQVFYRMEENVNGCYAQKPLKSIERILLASSKPGELALDFFAHSGTTLLAAERTGRRCYTADLDPVYCEIAIRRLERFHATGKTGWQNDHPFSAELAEIKDPAVTAELAQAARQSE
ncbi:MAG: site-specific DNA-methyltransferase [Chloroflexi bacterium]|nr:site-specific DNA-methyltransferase [Chloroflexota bacterium]OJV92357.1 MAG: site-specific DNA-methyltransferase [Chloroflexi bacterium 54-19]